MGDMATDQVTMAQAMLGLVWAQGGHTVAAGVEQTAAKCTIKPTHYGQHKATL